MRITSDQFLPATPQRAAQMLCDPAFIEFRSANTEARVEDSVVTGSPAGEFTLTTRRSVTADVIPAQMRAFVGERLEIRQVEAWAKPAADGTRTGTVVLEITGTPVRLTGTLALSAADGGSCVRYNGDLKAAVPLFAAAIEKAAATSIHSILDQETAAAREWLAAHPE